MKHHRLHQPESVSWGQRHRVRRTGGKLSARVILGAHRNVTWAKVHRWPLRRRTWGLCLSTPTPGTGCWAFASARTGPWPSCSPSCPEGPTAAVLADALNGSLQHRETAARRLDAVLDAVLADVPDDVRAAVSAVLPLLAATGTAQEHLRVTAALPGLCEPGPALFTTTNCPGRCEVCGICRDDCADCPRCRDFDCEVCLPVAITPRTAAALDAALGRLADEVYDIAEQTPLAGGGPAADAGDIVPPCVADRDPWFLRRYARAFDDLAADLAAGSTSTGSPCRTSCFRTRTTRACSGTRGRCHTTTPRTGSGVRQRPHPRPGARIPPLTSVARPQSHVGDTSWDGAGSSRPSIRRTAAHGAEFCARFVVTTSESIVRSLARLRPGFGGCTPRPGRGRAHRRVPRTRWRGVGADVSARPRGGAGPRGGRVRRG